MREQEGHLIGQYATPLKINIFRVRGYEGDGDEFHAGLFGRSSGLVVVAALAGGHKVSPAVLPTLT